MNKEAKDWVCEYKEKIKLEGYYYKENETKEICVCAYNTDKLKEEKHRDLGFDNQPKSCDYFRNPDFPGKTLKSTNQSFFLIEISDIATGYKHLMERGSPFLKEGLAEKLAQEFIGKVAGTLDILKALAGQSQTKLFTQEQVIQNQVKKYLIIIVYDAGPDAGSQLFNIHTTRVLEYVKNRIEDKTDISVVRPLRISRQDSDGKIVADVKKVLSE